MTAQGGFGFFCCCFNLWYANADAAAAVLKSLVRTCFLNVRLEIFPAFFVRPLILCITFLFSAFTLFCGKTSGKTNIYSSSG